MKLYIANCSHQTHQFNYKIPEKTQSFGVTIGAGKQHMLEYPPEVISSIIEQHEPYGFQRYDRVGNTFSGICYAIDRVISASSIKDNAEQKSENLENLSQEILEANAVSLNKAVDEAAIKSGEKPANGGIEIEIKGEAVNPDQDNPPKLNKTVRVQK
ncbi:hypothetical protein [Escherichia coli]|uniref:hypothetical protein n=1 Tax=Escherichia coli TaxID=562 RepID=UPI001919576A|nr:hypothetical protein [Escherichia coli]CAD6037131.1 Uncharacterised protein [Escherichia coli]CAD6099262.1 Uncharacterised protein [Escherichia coli]CAD6176205.1 Uncharacterised protein [Escherichia coli]